MRPVAPRVKVRVRVRVRFRAARTAQQHVFHETPMSLQSAVQINKDTERGRGRERERERERERDRV